MRELIRIYYQTPTWGKAKIKPKKQLVDIENNDPMSE